MPKNKEKYIAILADFGQGDVLASTPTFRGLRKKYPNHKIVAACVYTDLWKNNPNIDELYQLGQYHDFYDKYMLHLKTVNEDQKFVNMKFYEQRLANICDYPISKILCECADVEFDEDKLDLFLTEEEDEFGRDFVKALKKPVIVIQTESARPPTQGGNNKMSSEKDWFPESWTELVKRLSDKVAFVQVGGPKEFPIPGITSNLLGKVSIRQTAAIVKYATTFITIDSIVQHIGNAVNKKGIVLFGRSKLETLSHKSNINIVVPGSCEIMPCMGPEAGFSQLVIKGTALVGWTCPDKKCMKAITVDLVENAVVDNFLKL